MATRPSETQPSEDHRATRVYPESGIREVAEFFGPEELKMFGCQHLPNGSVLGGLVICSPLHAEFQRNYRREVELARRLASEGLAVQRFHYRGTGNSDGETASATYETMREDTLAAAEWLSRTASVTRLAFLGTRWGALMAASAAARYVGSPLVLWEPTVDSRRYFGELFRFRRLQALKEGKTGSGSGTPEEEIRRVGWIDVLGYSIDRPLYESAVERTLEDELGEGARPLLLIEISRSGQLRREYATLAARLEHIGFALDTEMMPWDEEAWWFAGGRTYQEERSMAGKLAGVTADWIARAMTHSRVSA